MSRGALRHRWAKAMELDSLAGLRTIFGISDEQAMWRVQTQDDEAAFAHLVNRWQGPIRRVCTRMTGDWHRGEDLAQETFARVYTQRKYYRPDGKVSTWIWRIALNLCYDDLRRRRRREEMPLDDAPEEVAAPTAEPDKLAAAEEHGYWVRWALLRLSESHRAVLALRHYENLKFREIAEVLEIPEGTVKSRMAEALTQMNRLLTPILQEGRALKPKWQQREMLIA
jgi:RNA polymerase sigma-70 factor, ECF subfamily